ncbi:MAG: Fic family protein [Legionellaceae bacterium]|nr:Fic family protein [Legionellaceae bacterium]
MCSAKFEHYNLGLVLPTFESPLTDLIIELDHLRRLRLSGTTNPRVFFQLKHIFHLLESVGSARIEGNNTTVAEYIETKLEKNTNVPPSIKEIQNIENAMNFIEEHAKDQPINRMFVSEMHKIIVDDLPLPPRGEGDLTPGKYREKNVAIANASHIPPDYSTVPQYMDELFSFISKDDSPKYDLLKVAIAHHRFVWVHPFSNGNGRTVRLFTYAMLVKLGFNVNVGRILNPTAVFCSNRDNYYYHLGLADKGTDEGILRWCQYVLNGLRDEIQKIDKLLDYQFLQKEILLPAVNFSLERAYITEMESKILRLVVEKQVIQANDLAKIFAGKEKSEVSRQIKKLIDKKMLTPESEGKRKYVIRFDNNYLLRSVIKILGEKGFLPDNS